MNTETWADYKEYEPKTEGLYLGRVLEITRDTGEYGEFVILRFALLEGPDEGETHGIASLKWSPKSKLYKWTKALNGGLTDGFKDGFKPSLVVNKCAQLVIKHEENTDGVRDVIAELIPINLAQAKTIRDLPKTETQLFADMEASI